MKKLAIITTHPIQYYAPIFKSLNESQNIAIKVFYTLGEKESTINIDKGFNKLIAWDIPLLDSYPYQWVQNIAAKPGSHHFKGIDNPDLIERVKTYQPDAILVFGWAYKSHLKLIRYFKNRIPLYFRGDSTLLDKQNIFKMQIRQAILKWVYRHIDIAFYTGTNSKAYFKKYGLNEKQLAYAPHAVDNQRFQIDRGIEVDELRKSLAINNNDILILYAGKLEDKKAPGLLLDAFLKLSVPGTHLLFVGDGILKETLKAKANLHANVHFIDFQNQSYMPVIYQACNLFCMPSKGPAETWGLAVNEAMACGKAVLVSDKCGCAVDLVTAKNGLIFKSESVENLTLSLKELISSKNYLIELGNQSKRIIKRWNFIAIAEAIEKKLTDEG